MYNLDSLARIIETHIVKRLAQEEPSCEQKNRAGVKSVIQEETSLEILGQGVFSTVVYDKISDTTIKIGFGWCHEGDPLTDGWLEWGLFCMDRSSEFSILPEVYNIRLYQHFFLAEIERLTGTPDMGLHRDMSVNRFKAGYTRSGAELEPTEKDDDDHMAGYEYRRFQTHSDGTLDIHDENVMMDMDGNIKITDPVSIVNEDNTTSSLERAGIKCHKPITMSRTYRSGCSTMKTSPTSLSNNFEYGS